MCKSQSPAARRKETWCFQRSGSPVEAPPGWGGSWFCCPPCCHPHTEGEPRPQHCYNCPPQQNSSEEGGRVVFVRRTCNCFFATMEEHHERISPNLFTQTKSEGRTNGSPTIKRATMHSTVNLEAKWNNRTYSSKLKLDVHPRRDGNASPT